MTRKFHLGDILTITTGRLVSPRHIEGVYDILNFMTGESLFTHQLPRALRVCGPVLLAKHPQLANVESYENLNAENCKAWLVRQVATFGEELDVLPLTPDAYEAKDPITELIEMREGKDDHAS